MCQVYTNLSYVPRTYTRVKKVRVLIINKDVRKSLACKNRNEIRIWSWNDSVVNKWYNKRMHKFGIGIPKSVE